MVVPVYDYHVHSNYSDGSLLTLMIDAAERAGLDGVGFADHCSVVPVSHLEEARARYGFNMDLTHERRREGLAQYRERTDLAVYDAVELDYHPEHEGTLGAFLEDAGFDYAVGSVHFSGGHNLQNPRAFEGKTDDALDRIVDGYFDRLTSLVESELFEVAAHPDLIERTEVLSGRATREQYRRAARAFADSRTIPEVNAGRALGEDGTVHPAPAFLEALRDHDVAVTVASDAHEPDELVDRAAFLEEFVAEHALRPVAPPGLDP